MIQRFLKYHQEIVVGIDGKASIRKWVSVMSFYAFLAILPVFLTFRGALPNKDLIEHAMDILGLLTITGYTATTVENVFTRKFTGGPLPVPDPPGEPKQQ